jgi:CSLREA domain-containing protein
LKVSDVQEFAVKVRDLHRLRERRARGSRKAGIVRSVRGALRRSAAALLSGMTLAGATLAFVPAALAQCAGTSCVVTSSADTVNGNGNPTLRDAITFARAFPV